MTTCYPGQSPTMPNNDNNNNEKHSNADCAICCDIDATQNTESDVSATPKEASHCMGNHAHDAPPPPPSNDRKVGFRKLLEDSCLVGQCPEHTKFVVAECKTEFQHGGRMMLTMIVVWRMSQTKSCRRQQKESTLGVFPMWRGTNPPIGCKDALSLWPQD
jgi:hypothetical protein